MMKKTIVTKSGLFFEDMTVDEIAQLEEQQALQEFEQSLQPSSEDLEQAEFELKTIELLINLGVI